MTQECKSSVISPTAVVLFSMAFLLSIFLAKFDSSKREREREKETEREKTRDAKLTSHLNRLEDVTTDLLHWNFFNIRARNCIFTSECYVCILERGFSKRSTWALADCEWRAAAPALKRLRLPRAPFVQLDIAIVLMYAAEHSLMSPLFDFDASCAVCAYIWQVPPQVHSRGQLSRTLKIKIGGLREQPVPGLLKVTEE